MSNRIYRAITKLLLLLLVTVTLGCNMKKKDDHAEEKGEPVQVTAYSERSELFMEFAEPVAGEKSPFLIKLTRLSDWKPVAAAPLTLEFTPGAGAALRFTVAAPVRPGVYETVITLPTAGEHRLAVIYQGKGGMDRIEVPEVHVLAEGEVHEHDEHGHGAADADGHAEQAHDEGDRHEAERDHGDEHGAEAAHSRQAGHDEEKEHAEEAHRKEKGHAEAGRHEEEDHHAAEADHGRDHDHAEEHGHGEEAGKVVVGTGGGTISYPKEQQWASDFMSRRAQRMDLASSFLTVGELVPVSNAEATVSAPVAGIISTTRPLPYLGKRVGKGEVVAVIEPPVGQPGGIGQLTADYVEAKNRVTLAQNEYDRAKRLYEAKIAPLKRVQEAELSLSSAKAALEPMKRALESVKGDSGNGRMLVRAPVAGTVVEIAAANGRGVEAGAPILRIINTGKLWLKASLPAAEAGKAAQAAGATFTVTGVEGVFRPSRLVTVNDMLDPQTRTLPVIFEVANPGARLKVGMFAEVSIRTGTAANALAVPADALVEDEGRWFLFVQTAGEWFERREVKVGVKDKGHVQITDGLKDHERVVVKGAYYVKLAATAGKAADPHAGHGH